MRQNRTAKLGLLGFAFAAMSVALVSGCTNEVMVGGPCEYRSWQTEATVANLQDEYVLMQADEDFRYVVDYDMFDGQPSVGDRYKLQLDTITEGTCTPNVVKSVALM
ncbi:hypothetical protein ACFSJ3_01325 [Corallincola platygyrae]|uniref:DUF4377 domain-containing protein n=1 Tax=Corallincola platygyrae TaxID=1193278 RepID=A0ABW4XGI4_9GAMM